MAKSVPEQFLGAFKIGHRPYAREFIDEELATSLLDRVLRSGWTADHPEKCSDQEALKALEYLTKFNNEFEKGVVKKGDSNALHNTDQLRRDIYNRHNKRRWDVTAQMGSERLDAKAGMVSAGPKVLSPIGHDQGDHEPLNRDRDLHTHEDTLIALLDAKNSLENDESTPSGDHLSVTALTEPSKKGRSK